MFWIPDPTLTFVSLPKKSAIFTVVEAQSAYIARALSGRLRLPYKSAMQEELEEEPQKLGEAFNDLNLRLPWKPATQQELEEAQQESKEEPEDIISPAAPEAKRLAANGFHNFNYPKD